MVNSLVCLFVVCLLVFRWPLMIDPQGQAIKWIKSMETQHVRVLSSDITKLCCGMYPNRVFNCLSILDP